MRDLREKFVAAICAEDAASVASLMRQHPPLTGYERGYNIAHVAAVSASSAIVRIIRHGLGPDWERLLAKPNHQGLTPSDVAREAGRPDFVECFLSDGADDDQHPQVSKAKPHPYQHLPIEVELEEQRLDAAGRKNRAKLSANANGKPYWKA